MADLSEKFGDTGIIELVGKIMVVTIIILLFVVVFVFCLHLYAKYFWYRPRREDPNTTAGRSLDFDAGESVVSRLEPSVLKTLPIIIFDLKEFKDGLECAVCLSEISQGEKTRLLPKCNHGFHLGCIDMWFESHSTCPLCRDLVKNEPPFEAIIQVENSSEVPNFPTNVLIYGDETQVSTFSPCVEESNAIVDLSSLSSMVSTSGTSDDAILRVDISRQINEDDEQKSPLPKKLRSLKRLLSYNSGRRVNISSSRNLDLEQGDSRG